MRRWFRPERLWLLASLGIALPAAAAQPSTPASSIQPPAIPPKPDLPFRGDPLVPFVLQLAGPESVSPGQELELRITLERRILSTVPIRLTIELPSGVELVRGDLEEVIVDGETSRIERSIRIAIGERVPGDDLQVHVGQRGEGWGAHATQTYRFGRPEPAPPEIERDAPVILDGENLGRPIRLRKAE